MSIAFSLLEIFPLDKQGQIPILDSGTSPRDNDHPAYEKFNDQVQARSSVTSDAYRREDLLDSGLEVLALSSRDLKVLVTIGDVLLTAEMPEDLQPVMAYLDSLHRALGPYWDRLHPLPEAKNWVRVRQGLLTQMAKGIERMAQWAFGTTTKDQGLQIVQQITSLAALQGLEEQWYETKHALLELAAAIENQIIRQQAPSTPTPSKAESAPSTMAPRELRQRFLELADQLKSNSGEVDVPLVFALQRKAAFLAFEGEVQADKGVTALTDIAADRVSEVLTASKSPTPEALLALEGTLQSRPLWLTGHRLAAEMAQALDKQAQANAITAATLEEVSILGHEIIDYTFKDGLPFADLATKAWIREDRKTEKAQSGDNEVSGGTFAQLDILDKRVQETPPSTSARERSLVLVELAEVLAEAGHGAVAAVLAQQMRDDLTTRGLLEWEETLSQRLKTLIR